MSDLREAAIRTPRDIRNTPELAEIPDEAFPKNIFLVLDGNSRWIERKTTGALAGNPSDITIIQNGVQRLHGLFTEFVAETPELDRPYVGAIQDLAENFVRLPIEDAIKQLRDLKVLPLLGHLYGTDTLEMHLRSLRGLPIDYVGAWGLSAENFTRPGPEVDGLMWLFERELARHEQELQDANARFMHLGNKDKLPKRLQDKLQAMEKTTAANPGQVFYLALGYSGEDQELRAMQRLNDNPEPSGTIFDAQTRKKYLDGSGNIPSADLIYLPGRSSSKLTHASDLGYLHAKGTQLYLEETLWPDTTTQILVDGIAAYAKETKSMGGRPQVAPELPEKRNGKLPKEDNPFVQAAGIARLVRASFSPSPEDSARNQGNFIPERLVSLQEEQLIRENVLDQPNLLQEGLQVLTAIDAEITRRHGEEGHHYFHQFILGETKNGQAHIQNRDVGRAVLATLRGMKDITAPFRVVPPFTGDGPTDVSKRKAPRSIRVSLPAKPPA